MFSKRSVALGLALGFALGAGLGGFLGWRQAYRFLLEYWVQEQAHDVRGHINSLRQLRNGTVAAAIESLESRLDDDLVILEPKGYRLTPPILRQMHEAFRAAKQYRAETPRHSERDSVDKMVADILSKDIPPAPGGGS